MMIFCDIERFTCIICDTTNMCVGFPLLLGLAFSSPCNVMPIIPVLHFPSLYFGRCRIFQSRIFSRPVAITFPIMLRNSDTLNSIKHIQDITTKMSQTLKYPLCQPIGTQQRPNQWYHRRPHTSPPLYRKFRMRRALCISLSAIKVKVH